jgi:hypothetical protein
MVTNNRNNSCIVASGVYTWVRHNTSTEIYGKTLQSTPRRSDRKTVNSKVTLTLTLNLTQGAVQDLDLDFKGQVGEEFSGNQPDQLSGFIGLH